MPMRKPFACAALLLGLTLPISAFAEQRADWLLAAPAPPGNFASVDVIFGAVQGSVEHRENIHGIANQLTVRASAIAAVPFGGAQADVDLRILVLTLGMSGGVVDSWRNQSFGADEAMTRKERRLREAGGLFNAAQYGFWEGRIQLDLPFDEWFVLHNVNYYRVTTAPSRSFDDLIGVVHDGDYWRSDFQLFVKHRDWGAIGPMMQLLNYPLGDRRINQLNYGFALISRAGLVRRDDFVFLQMLWNVGDTLGGYDNRQNYGMQMLRGPVMFTLAYRSVINL